MGAKRPSAGETRAAPQRSCRSVLRKNTRKTKSVVAAPRCAALCSAGRPSPMRVHHPPALHIAHDPAGKSSTMLHVLLHAAALPIAPITPARHTRIHLPSSHAHRYRSDWGDDYWRIKQVLRHRVTKRGPKGEQREYLVKWDGVDPNTKQPWEDSWQPAENLTADVLSQYESRRGLGVPSLHVQVDVAIVLKMLRRSVAHALMFGAPKASGFQGRNRPRCHSMHVGLCQLASSRHSTDQARSVGRRRRRSSTFSRSSFPTSTRIRDTSPTPLMPPVTLVATRTEPAPRRPDEPQAHPAGIETATSRFARCFHLPLGVRSRPAALLRPC